MSFAPIASGVAAPTNSGTPPYRIVSKEVTPIMPPGFTETQTTKADGVVTTVVTNASGGVVNATFSTSTVETSGTEVSVWA